MCGSFFDNKILFYALFSYLKILKATFIAIRHQNYACQSFCLLSFMPRCIRDEKMLYDSHWWHSSTISLIICFLWAFFNFFSASFKKTELKPQPDIPHKKTANTMKEREIILYRFSEIFRRNVEKIYIYTYTKEKK